MKHSVAQGLLPWGELTAGLGTALLSDLPSLSCGNAEKEEKGGGGVTKKEEPSRGNGETP